MVIMEPMKESFSLKNLPMNELNEIAKMLTEEERRMIAEQQGNCLREMFFKKVVPAVAIAGGCTFAARKIFPNKLVVSPVGLGMIITGAALYSLGSSMRLCYDRVNPTVQSIFEKYVGKSSIIGMRNKKTDQLGQMDYELLSVRQAEPSETLRQMPATILREKWVQEPDYGTKTENILESPQQIGERHAAKRTAMQELASTWSEKDKKVISSFLDDQPAYMPGTPTVDTVRKPHQSQYGDEGFS